MPSFYLLATIFLLTLAIRSLYDFLKYRGKIKTSRPVFWLLFANMMVLWLSWFGLCDSDSCHYNFPDIVRYSGLGISLAGIILFLTALIQLRFFESDTAPLVKNGLYRVLRHPMYVAFICWLIGFPLFKQGCTAQLLGLLGIFNVLFWRALEEKMLIARIPEYREYRKTTWF